MAEVHDDEVILQTQLFEGPDKDAQVKVFLPGEEMPEEDEYSPQQTVLLDNEMMEVISLIPEDKKEAFRSFLNLLATAAYQVVYIRE